MNVLVLDPNSTVREALRELFVTELGAEVVVGSSLSSLGTIADLRRFDVVVVEEQIAGGLSDVTHSALDRLSPGAPVVVMGIGEREFYEEPHVIAGAVGYWPKSGEIDDLVALARAACLVAHADRACVVEKTTRSARSAHLRARRRRVGSNASTESLV